MLLRRLVPNRWFRAVQVAVILLAAVLTFWGVVENEWTAVAIGGALVSLLIGPPTRTERETAAFLEERAARRRESRRRVAARRRREARASSLRDSPP
jgi:hypothetical protein